MLRPLSYAGFNRSGASIGITTPRVSGLPQASGTRDMAGLPLADRAQTQPLGYTPYRPPITTPKRNASCLD